MTALILGGAVSGIAAGNLARRRGYDIAVYDEDPMVAHRFDSHFSFTGDWVDAYLDRVDIVVASPGFPEHSIAIRSILASGVPLVSEIEFAVTDLGCPYAAITGTNGKTTTTRVAADMLVRSGLNATAAGNIGNPLSDVVAEEWDAVVIEASSFQLRFIDTFHPRVAAVLNVAPDHLDWHGDYAAYAAAKARIFENQGPDDLLLFDVDDPGAAAVVGPATSRAVPVSGHTVPNGGHGVRDGALVIAGHEMPVAETDPSYLVDLVIAGAVAIALGAIPAAVAEVAAGFQRGAHRRAEIGSWSGVTWVNDSKATNPHAAAAAATAYRSVILVAGGRNKDLDLSPLAAVGSIKHVIAIGETRHEFAALFPDRVSVIDSADGGRALAAAVAEAASVADPGDTVLLAPGCASFDMFEAYGRRGDEFAHAVRAFHAEVTS